MHQDTPRARFFLYLKGMAMGAADIVPGVSGGTIAFIAGIYERLLNALKSFGPHLWPIFRQQGITGVWREIDGTFLLILFAGILTSVFSMANLITHLLLVYPEMIWSFFFGLTLVSAWYVGVQIRHRNWQVWLAFLIGAAAAYLITDLSPSDIQATPLSLFLCGMIAICAMILPGISGSFILLILGMYAHILNAVKMFQLSTLLIFASGCLVGLLSISRLLSWMLRRYHDFSLALLTGFMIGALNKVWPWKQTLQTRLNSSGEEIPFIQTNVLPAVYESVTGQSAHLTGAIVCAIVGVVLIVLLEKVRTE